MAAMLLSFEPLAETQVPAAASSSTSGRQTGADSRWRISSGQSQLERL